MQLIRQRQQLTFDEAFISQQINNLIVMHLALVWTRLRHNWTLCLKVLKRETKQW